MPIYPEKPAAGPESSAADYDLDALQIGPATYMLSAEADAQGRVGFRIGSRAAQGLQLGEESANQCVGIIDNFRAMLVCDPATNRLIAVAGHPSGHTRVIFFGLPWGAWTDDTGRRRSNDDPLEMMRDLRFPLGIDDAAGEVALDFNVNIYNREAFSLETRRLFREGHFRTQITLTFAAPSGDYLRGELVMLDMQSGVRKAGMMLREFPLLWPSAAAPQESDPGRARFRPREEPAEPRAQARPAHAPESREPAAENENEPPRAKLRPPRPKDGAPPPPPRQPEEPPRAKLQSRPAPPPPPQREPPPQEPPPRASTRYSVPPQPSPPPRASHERPGTPPRRPPPKEEERPLPRTETMALSEMVGTIHMERNPERRWRMIEPNLMLGRPERTYALISNFAEMLMEKTIEWPPARLRAVFRDQPGSVLIAIMTRWYMNQILAVAEGNAEAEKITQWLREREIERLLRLEIGGPILGADAARRDLHIDKNADEAAIRRTWRTLLSFMNADLGRQEERAIHRKKDEIAKHLQAARDYLIKGRSK